MSKNMIRQWKSKYNSFNGMKALIHVPYWKEIIEKGTIPPPIFMSIDPCGVCNLRCPHCNAAEILRSKHTIMDKEMIDKVVDLLSFWKTKAVCIGGGGESLLNEKTYYLMDELVKNNVQIATITNGIYMNKHIDTILKNSYVGISVDAVTNETWQRVKGVTNFNIDTVFNNISDITGRGTEITYKYLLLPYNHHEVYKACKKAKELGCDQFHLRPATYPWFDYSHAYDYSEEIRKDVSLQLDKARDHFKIFGVIQKFDDEWKVTHTFDKCWACYITGAISPDGMVTVCCDRRGDKTMELGYVDEMKNLWGSDKHKNIHKTVNINTCPRCTYSNVNEIFEQVIIKDGLFCNFV